MNNVEPFEDNTENIDILENSDLNSSLDNTENNTEWVTDFVNVTGEAHEIMTVNPKDKSLKKATQYFV